MKILNKHRNHLLHTLVLGIHNWFMYWGGIWNPHPAGNIYNDLFLCRLTYRQHAWCSSVSRSSWNSLTGALPKSSSQSIRCDSFIWLFMFHSKTGFSSPGKYHFISFPTRLRQLMVLYKLEHPSYVWFCSFLHFQWMNYEIRSVASGSSA
jgi:hypothetical protein